MKKSIIAAILAFVSVSVSSTAQESTITHPAYFKTTNQNVWGPGSTQFGLNVELPIIPEFSFGIPKVEYNYIETLAGMDFGFGFGADTWGTLGLTLSIRDNNGKVAINYDTDVTLTMPSDFNRGEEVTIRTRYVPKPGNCRIDATDYKFSIDMNLKAAFGAVFDMKACAFGCLDENLFDFDLGNDNFEIFSLTPRMLYVFENSDSIESGLDGEYRKSDKFDAFNLWMRLPDKGAPNHSMSGSVLYCRSAPYVYDTLNLDIPRAIAKILKKKSDKSPNPDTKAKLKLASQIFKNLDKTINMNGASIYYNILKADLNLTTLHNQLLTFKPKIMTRMKFPGIVDYRVLNLGDTLLLSGKDSIVDFEVGNKISFRFPCNYEFMDISSEYSIKNDNNFSLDSYDSISLSFTLSAIAFNIKVNDIVVIPEFCFDYCYPNPKWNDPFNWDCDEVCTPALVFQGFHWGFGPMYSDDFQLAQYKYRWKKASWSMQGFNTIKAGSFRMEPLPFFVTLTSKDIKCYGNKDGRADATVTNGTPPYQYEWSNGSVAYKAENLSPGTHYVIVRDKNGCTAFADVFIHQPTAPLSINPLVTDVDCYGNSTGNIELNPAGGTPPYRYEWTGNGTTEDLLSVPANTYKITVKDTNDCSLSQFIEIKQPYGLTVVPAVSDVACSGELTGSASLTVSGGVAPYLYNWSSGDSTHAEIDSLAAGNYAYTVKDFKGCMVSDTLVITQPAHSLNVAVTVQDVLCHGDASGNILLSLTGGTTPYTATWFTPGGQILNQDATSLHSISTGTYNVVVSDSLGCQEDTVIYVPQPPLIEWDIATVNNLCFGEAKGSADINVSGGIPAYTYLWSDGSSDTMALNLYAGTYWLSLTDQNGCRNIISATILQPDEAVTGTVVPDPVLCFGEYSGNADLIPSGGIPPYTFLWSNNTTNEDLNSVPAGTYTVNITDSNGCPAKSGTVITQPTMPLTIQNTITNPSCFGFSDGSMLIKATGATTPYYMRWDDTEYLINNEGHFIQNLPAGNFKLLVTDANGCEAKEVASLQEPGILAMEISTSIVTCYGGSDGAVDLDLSGGSQPYTFAWSNGDAVEDISGLATGTYSVTVTDAQNCLIEGSGLVNTMTEITTYANIVPISCSDNYDGSIDLATYGGGGSYAYTWSNGEMGKYVENLAVGDYAVTITDALGCSRFLEYYVPSNPKQCLSIPTLFTPNGDGRNDDWVIHNLFLYPSNNVKIFNRLGRLMYEGNPYHTPWDGTHNGNPVPAETYYYIISLNNGTPAFTGTVVIIR